MHACLADSSSLSLVLSLALCKRFVHFVLPTFWGVQFHCVSCISHFLAAASCLVGVLVMTPTPTPLLPFCHALALPPPPLSACKCALNTQQADKRLQQQILHLNCVSNCWTCLKLQLNQLHPVPGPTLLPLPSSCTWHKLQQNLAKYKYKYECLCVFVCVCVCLPRCGCVCAGVLRCIYLYVCVCAIALNGS